MEREILALEGEVDLAVTPALRQRLLARVAPGRALMVDLSAVTYIDSSGLASLVEAYQAAQAEGGRLALVAASQQVRRVLELARLDRVFTLVERAEDPLPV